MILVGGGKTLHSVLAKGGGWVISLCLGGSILTFLSRDNVFIFLFFCVFFFLRNDFYIEFFTAIGRTQRGLQPRIRGHLQFDSVRLWVFSAQCYIEMRIRQAYARHVTRAKHILCFKRKNQMFSLDMRIKNNK